MMLKSRRLLWQTLFPFVLLLPLLALTIQVHGKDLISGDKVVVDARSEMRRLLHEVDTDGDNKITILDLQAGKSTGLPASFQLKSRDGKLYEVKGIYFLSNLLEELTLAQDRAGADKALIDAGRIFEDPVHRVSRLIREVYWDGLTRRMDIEHLRPMLSDSKVKESVSKVLYVPYDDEEALIYFSQAARAYPDLKLRVLRLPKEINKEASAKLDAEPGPLTLALQRDAAGHVQGVPFIVPGGRFNEMYGWDSYFEALGLLVDGRVDLARSMVDNLVYEITHYGKVLNGNRTYYLKRSQPPFLTSMIRAVYEHLPRNPETKDWLAHSLMAAISDYDQLWNDGAHLTKIGLNRYFDEGWGVPFVVESGHFDAIYEPFAKKQHLSVARYAELYKEGKIQEPDLDRIFTHDRTEEESGHDTTYRWRTDGVDHCADFVTIDLNALLYKIEVDISSLLRSEFKDGYKGQSWVTWRERARKRKARILKYLWDPNRKMFFDYDFVKGRRSKYLSATSLYPLWTWDSQELDTQILNSGEAKEMADAVLAELEMPGGIAATSQASVKSFGDPQHPRQWDFPNGWAPHQIIAWSGLRKYGLTAVADRLTYRWLYMIARNASEFNGTVPEKFDVLKRSHNVFTEYGNIGTKFNYITREGFGWMNASFEVGLNTLSKHWLSDLERLIPPEWLNFAVTTPPSTSP